MTAPPTPAHRMNPDTAAEQFDLPPVALAWPCRDEGPSAAAFAGHASPERVADSLYLPARDLQLLAEDMGHAPTAAAALEFTDPCFARDALLSRLGLRLKRRLRRGDRPSRLELDELALRIGERLWRPCRAAASWRRWPRSSARSAPRRATCARHC